MDHAEEIEFHIREQTLIARAAAFFLKGQKVAIVIGNTIHLHGTKEVELLATITWLRHELRHVQQYRQHGKFLFLAKYGWESLRNGYRNNRYEIEAREAEGVSGFEKKFKVVSRRRSG
ncbi:MAG: hypothetical protein JWM14_923 [Chitinophagaceae bacterium]|nr:hypothetical protein [Chitinophagaceae bacterium]